MHTVGLAGLCFLLAPPRRPPACPTAYSVSAASHAPLLTIPLCCLRARPAPQAARMLGKPESECNLVICHLGAGSSMCAVKVCAESSSSAAALVWSECPLGSSVCGEGVGAAWTRQCTLPLSAALQVALSFSPLNSMPCREGAAWT